MRLRENLKLLVVIVNTSVTQPLHYHHRLHLFLVTYDWLRDDFVEFVSSLGFDVENAFHNEERQC
jgi:phosphoglycerate-specific signal transduction histidine kinase